MDTHEKILEENKIRDKRIDTVQDGMVTNHKELQGIKENMSRNVKKISKILTAMYNKISPEAQLSFDDWEFEDEATLDNIISMYGATVRQEKKRKTYTTNDLERDSSMNMETEKLITQPTPTNNSGMNSVADP